MAGDRPHRTAQRLLHGGALPEKTPLGHQVYVQRLLQRPDALRPQGPGVYQAAPGPSQLQRVHRWQQGAP